MLSANVTERIIVDDRLQDLDVSTNEWKPLPGCDLYAAGFPCTPWSRHHLSSCIKLFAFIIMSDCWWMVKFEPWRTSHKGVKNNMSSHAMSFHVITSCQIMSRHVMSCHIMSFPHVKTTCSGVEKAEDSLTKALSRFSLLCRP